MRLKKFNESSENVEDVQRVIAEFYMQYEDSYIDGNTHGVIERLLKRLQRNNMLPAGDLMAQIDTLGPDDYDIEDDED